MSQKFYYVRKLGNAQMRLKKKTVIFMPFKYRAYRKVSFW